MLFVSAPWIGLTTVPQWDRVYLVPFSDVDDKPRDLILNLAMFIPFGYSFLKHRPGRRRLLAALGAAMAVSVVAEATQLFSTLRNPSGTDVTMAALGGGLGGAFRQAVERLATGRPEKR